MLPLLAALVSCVCADGAEDGCGSGSVPDSADTGTPDPANQPFGHIVVDPILCIGCKLCTSKGPDGAFLEGCPWDAIDMVPLTEFEAQYGSLPF